MNILSTQEAIPCLSNFQPCSVERGHALINVIILSQLTMLLALGMLASNATQSKIIHLYTQFIEQQKHQSEQIFEQEHSLAQSFHPNDLEKRWMCYVADTLMFGESSGIDYLTSSDTSVNEYAVITTSALRLQ